MPETILRRWSPQARIVRDENWIVRAQIGEDDTVAIVWNGDVVVGIVEGHLRDDKSECSVYLSLIDKETPHWTVEEYSPLTLSPKVKCTVCTHEGYITEGKWVPA